MENNFQYEAMLARAKAIACAKAAGQAIPKEPPLLRGKQPRSDFDFDVALKRAREKSVGISEREYEV